jgi:hypothetical protein
MERPPEAAAAVGGTVCRLKAMHELDGVPIEQRPTGRGPGQAAAGHPL